MLTETFGLFTNAGLTNSFSGIYDLVHYTNLSDNPQDFTLYLGSLGSAAGNTSDRLLQTLSGPGINNITLTVTDNLATWVASTVRTLGDGVQPTVKNGKRYICTTAGTSHASVQPTWPTTPYGSTVTDGTAVWTLTSLKHETTEIILALTAGALVTNTPGGALAIATSITSGTAGDIPIYIRVTNAVTMVSNNTATPEIILTISNLVETQP